MAFSDVLNEGQKTEQAAPAPDTTPAPKAGTTANSNAGSEFRNTGASLRASLSDDQKAAEGSKSDKVEFIAVLMNPAKKSSRVENKKSIPSHPVVGYKLRLLEDAMVPYAPLKSNNELDVENITYVQHKAGEVISLNIIETGAFISKVEYGGRFCGNGKAVVIGAAFSKERPGEPRPVLNLEENSGSIKTSMELIADMKTIDGGTVAVVKDEFKDTFGKLFIKKTVGNKPNRNGQNKVAGESYKNLAAAFRDMYAKKTV